jgi:hypothetical protein
MQRSKSNHAEDGLRGSNDDLVHANRLDKYTNTPLQGNLPATRILTLVLDVRHASWSSPGEGEAVVCTLLAWGEDW